MERGLSVQVSTREEAVAVLEHRGLPPEHIAFQLFVAEGR